METTLRIPGETHPGIGSIMEGFQEENWLDLETYISRRMG
jgi:hypothetical protein